MTANLSGATLLDANLSEAILSHSNLSRADLMRADFSGASLSLANLSEANFLSANFHVADLSWSDLMNIRSWRKIKSIKFANILGVKNAPEGFTEWAKEQGAVSIENYKEWENFRREKMQEQTKKKQ